MQKKNVILALCLTFYLPSAFPENLISIFNEAIHNDPNVKAAQLQVEMSEAQRGQAGGALLPQVSGNVYISGNNQTLNNTASTFTGERYSVALTQSVIDLPKFMNWKRYQNIVAQSEASSEEAEQTLIFKVVEGYFKVLEATDTLALIEEQINSTQLQLRQMQQRREKQMATITDVYELEAKLDLLMADKIEAQTKIDVAQQGLIELTGHPISRLSPLRADIKFPALGGVLDEWLSHLEAQNPGLNAQDKAILAANDNVLQQKSKHLPTVDLQMNYYNTNTGYQNSQTPHIDTQVVAVNVTIPLFSGGITTKATDEASKNLEMSKQKRIALLRSLIKDTRDSFLSTNASVKRISAAEKALSTSTKAREAMEKGFEYGMQTISDVLVSQSREFKAKQDILQAKYAYITNRARFEQATGYINEGFLQSINQWLASPPAATTAAVQNKTGTGGLRPVSFNNPPPAPALTKSLPNSRPLQR